MIELSDTDRIRNLLGRYCECIDAGDFESLGDLFVNGALAAGEGDLFAVGPESVAAFYRAGTQLYEGSPRTKHIVTNTVFAERTELNPVIVRSSYTVLQATDQFPLQPIISGRYRDQFSLVDGEWCFFLRRFFVDQVGDLSRHLVDPSIAER